MPRIICLGLVAAFAMLIAACAAAPPTRTGAAENRMWQPKYDYSGAYVDLQAPPAMQAPAAPAAAPAAVVSGHGSM